MAGAYIEENLFVKHNIIDPNSPEGERIHKFLFSRLEALAGRYIDFKKTPIQLVLSDKEEPNAFFARVVKKEDKPIHRRDEDRQFTSNPLSMPVIAVTKGLIDFVDSLDELDYVLGHEVTHRILRDYVDRNSKGEEEIADLHGVDLVYDAGGDPKQALEFEKKSQKLSEQIKDRLYEIKDESRDRQDQIDWSSIFDVHMTSNNRISGIEAALTRLSHLIDERKPCDFDKSIFDVEYKDPVDAYLEQHNFDTVTPEKKLECLIDCIDHLAKPIAAQTYFNEWKERILKESGAEYRYSTEQKIRTIDEAIDDGYKHYFFGALIDVDMQQKIARIAEKLFKKIGKAHNKGDGYYGYGYVGIDIKPLLLHLENAAYKHIQVNGYPKDGDYNYLDSAGVMYSYFYSLLTNHVGRDAKLIKAQKPTELEKDILSCKERLRILKTSESFYKSVADFNNLKQTLIDIRTIKCQTRKFAYKLNKISKISNYNSASIQDNVSAFSAPRVNKIVAWNNLVAIAQKDDKAKKEIVAFLAEQDIQDYRITHGKPYIKINNRDCYRVNKDGRISKVAVCEHQIDYETQRESVDALYAYIQNYFESESTGIDKLCGDIVTLQGDEFSTPVSNKINEHDDETIGHRKIYNLVGLHNNLPDPDKRKYRSDYASALEMIPERYREQNPPPAHDEHGNLEITENLIQFDNPIFIKNFGKVFKKKFSKQKEASRQKIFDTILHVMVNLAGEWRSAEVKRKALSAQEDVVWDEIRNSEGEKFKTRKREEQKRISLRKEHYRALEYDYENILLNFATSIFDGQKGWYGLSKLTKNQKIEIAKRVVQNDNNVFLDILGDRRFEYFCDYLNLLKHQTDRVLNGDFTWTEEISAVANTFGYTPIHTLNDIGPILDVGRKDDSRSNQLYFWNLLLFDIVQKLEHSSEISIKHFANAITKINPSNISSSSGDDYNVAQGRSKTYKKFMNEGPILSLLTKVLSDQKNYENLSSNELRSTAEYLISLKQHLEPVWATSVEEDSNYKKKYSFDPKHEKLLNQIDRKIRGCLRLAEMAALKHNDKLEQCVDLYKVYKRKMSLRNGGEKSQYTKTLINEGRLQDLSNLSKDPNFWPEDVLDHVKAYVFAKNTFLDDRTLENTLLNDILSKVENLPSAKKKKDCLHILLDQNIRAAYPDTRERLFQIYADDLKDKLGMDDSTNKYLKRLERHLDGLSSSKHYHAEWDIGQIGYNNRDPFLSGDMAAADKYVLLRYVSDTIISQENTSALIKDKGVTKLDNKSMTDSYFCGIGIDYMTEMMDRDEHLSKEFLKFLNSKGQKDDCEKISQVLTVFINDNYAISHNYEDRIEKATPEYCDVLFQNFWSAPLEARTVVTARILKSAIIAEDKENDTAKVDEDEQERWERVFDLVMETVIKPDDHSLEAQYAREVMHSYIKARSHYERELILSAMMVANQSIGEDAGNIGKALKLFLENMGPAEIKLGQAIASHPKTPENIRVELQELKNVANIPARWTVFEWIRNENIPEKFWKSKRLGQIRGGSYYVTSELGDDEILRLLRPESREKADKGFRVIGDGVDDLNTKQLESTLDFGELTSSVQEMVTQAAKMSHVETNHEIGEKQCESAKDIYNGVVLRIGDKEFPLKVMDWHAYGQNWVIMERAHGPIFNEMPENTPEQIAQKKDFAKCYIVFEVLNILSGKKFDHDKHGAQLCISDMVGIFDTGAMALDLPSPEDQKKLGMVIYDVLKAASNGEDIFSAFSNNISAEINELYKQGADTQYLVEVKKGLLALGDFFKVLDQDDIQDVLPALSMISELSEHVQSGIESKLTLADKAKLQFAFSTKFAQHKPAVEVIRTAPKAVSNLEVIRDTTAPTIVPKASWLQQLFEKSGAGESKNPLSSIDPISAQKSNDLRLVAC